MPAPATGRTVIGMGAAEDAVTLYLVVLAVVFAVNLLPAFAPPTWAVLVWFAVSYHPQPAALVVLGALAAAGGRLVLALGARRARGRLSPERTARLGAASDALARSRGGAAAALGLFFLSPLPSGQLFVAAGLLAVRLRPLLLAFLAGRLVSYSIYVTAGTAAGATLGGVIGDALRSPLGIALNVAMLLALALLVRLDWPRLLRRRGQRPEGPAGTGSSGAGASTTSR